LSCLLLPVTAWRHYCQLVLLLVLVLQAMLQSLSSDDVRYLSIQTYEVGGSHSFAGQHC
jgi:hypothetical protein